VTKMFYDVFFMISNFVIDREGQRISTIIYDEMKIFIIESDLL
jgi:hypothetical protein